MMRPACILLTCANDQCWEERTCERCCMHAFLNEPHPPLRNKVSSTPHENKQHVLLSGWKVAKCMLMPSTTPEWPTAKLVGLSSLPPTRWATVKAKPQPRQTRQQKSKHILHGANAPRLLKATNSCVSIYTKLGSWPQRRSYLRPECMHVPYDMARELCMTVCMQSGLAVVAWATSGGTTWKGGGEGSLAHITSSHSRPAGWVSRELQTYA